MLIIPKNKVFHQTRAVVWLPKFGEAAFSCWSHHTCRTASNNERLVILCQAPLQMLTHLPLPSIWQWYCQTQDKTLSHHTSAEWLITKRCNQSLASLSSVRLVQTCDIHDAASFIMSLRTFSIGPSGNMDRSIMPASEGKISGSEILPADLPNCTLLDIRHLVLDGSRNWVVGYNVTFFSDIFQCSKKVMAFPKPSGTTCAIDHQWPPYFSSGSHFFRSITNLRTFLANKIRPLKVHSAQLANASLLNCAFSWPWGTSRPTLDQIYTSSCL